MTTTDDRLSTLEIALAHQERVVEDLNAVVLDQATRLERLERQAKALAARLVTAEAALADSAPNERPPPHW